VLLAMGLLMLLLGLLFGFYNQALRVRRTVVEGADRVAGMRLILDRMTDELRAVIVDRRGGRAVQGGAESIGLLSAGLPGRSSWSQAGGSDDPPTPTPALRWIEYGLLLDDEAQDEAGRPLILGLRRSERRLEPTVAQDAEELTRRHLISESIRFVAFEYDAGGGAGEGNWLSSWSGGDAPHAVRITLGLQPLPEGTDPRDYPFRTWRRVVSLPVGFSNERLESGDGGPVP
jgi:hypothetical protein